MITPIILKCAHCVRFDNPNCFHHPVGDHAYMESVKIEWCSLLETHNHIFNSENIDKMTINLEPDDFFGTANMSNIEFNPQSNPQTDEQRREFSDRLNENLCLLGLYRRTGNIRLGRKY